MAKSEDVAQVEREMAELQAEADRINKTYSAYSEEVLATVKGILTEAGVWAEVNGLELEREETRKKAYEKIQVIQAKFSDLEKVRTYLLGKVTPETAPAPVAEIKAAKSKEVKVKKAGKQVEVPAEPEVAVELTEAAPAESGEVAVSSEDADPANGKVVQLPTAQAEPKKRPTPPAF